MSQAMVILEHVSKNFGKVCAVDKLSLSVEQGKVVSLLGPSGCGKTTSLRILAGLESPDDGVVRLNGTVVADPRHRVNVPAHKRNVGMVFQSYAIWPHMTLADNVAYPLKYRGLQKSVIREKVLTVVDLVGLAGLEDRPATMLSGGQQQRVALARALIYQPNLLLLDEPFSNLDAKLREQMRVELKLLQRRLGITIIFVTHDQIEALSLSDWIVLMNNGHEEQSGKPQDLYDQPLTPFARDFLGKTIIFRGEFRSDDYQPSVNIHGFICPLKPMIDKNNIRNGAEVHCAIRPEDVSVRPAEPNRPSTTALHGIIETILFVGDHYEGRVRISDNDRVLLHLSKDERWAEGQPVAVEFSPEKLTIWTS